MKKDRIILDPTAKNGLVWRDFVKKKTLSLFSIGYGPTKKVVNRTSSRARETERVIVLMRGFLYPDHRPSQ